MAFCSKCGNSLEEGTLFCPQCGTPVNKPSSNDSNHQVQQSNYQSQYSHNQNSSYQTQYNYGQQYQNQNPYYNQQKPSIDTNGLMVWSIINLFLCLPASVYSLITLNNVHKAQTQTEAENYYKNAKTACIIATVVGVLFIIISMVAANS